MEKMGNSHIDRIISPDKDNEGLVFLLDKIGAGEVPGELEKTERDLELINFSQKCLDEYLSDFGKKDIYEVPYEKIHIVPVGKVKESTNGQSDEGLAFVQHGSCLIDRNLDDISYSIVLFHELYHIKSFTSVSVDNQGFINPRRSGFGVMVKNEKGDYEKYFGKINETLNDYFCNKFFNEKIKNSNLFNKEDVDNYQLELPRVKLLDLFEEKSEELFQSNRNEYGSKEEIKKLFIDADINGNLLPIARLIEKTYGQGSFRDIGEKMKY